MANGDITEIDRNRFMVKLLDAQTNASNGVWVEVPPDFTFRSFVASSLEEGATDATIDIMVSNDATKPADGTDGPTSVQLTNASATAYAAAKTESYRWVKAKKTAGTTPIATTVMLVANRG